MDMNGTIEVTVGNVTIKTGSDGRHYACFNVDLELGEKQAEEILGVEFRAAAFGSRHKTVDPSPQGDATVERLGYHSFKPPKWMRFEVHRCDFWGVKGDSQPVVKQVLSDEAGEHVIVELHFEVEVGRQVNVIGHFGAKVDSVVKIKLAPKSPKLGLQDRKADEKAAGNVVPITSAKKKKASKGKKKAKKTGQRKAANRPKRSPPGK